MRYGRYLVAVAILIVSGVVYSNFAKVIRSTEILLGLDADQDIQITADTLGAPDPHLKWNEANQRWEFSNDGTTTKPLGAGKGIHQNILQDSNFDIEDKQTAPFTVTITPGNLALEQLNPAFETTSLAWTPDAVSAESLLSELVPIPEGYYSQQCEARFFYKGGPAGMVFKVTNGTGTLAERPLSQPSLFTETSLTFVCPSSGSIQIQIDAPTTATVAYFDDFYIGESLTSAIVRDGDGVIAEGYYSEVAGCGDGWSLSTTGAPVNNLGLDPECNSINPVTEKYGVTIDVTDNNTLDIVVNNLPVGQYLVQAFFPTTHDANANSTLRIWDGSSYGIEETEGRPLGYNAPRVLSGIFNYTSQSTKTFSIRGSVTSGTMSVNLAGSQGATATWRITRLGDELTQKAVIPEMQGWYVDANIGSPSGQNTGFNDGAHSDYIAIGSPDLEITLNNDSAPATIPCNGTNSSEAFPSQNCNTTGGGNENLGIIFDAPLAGVYEVCSEFGTFWSGGTANFTMQLIETTDACSGTTCLESADGIQRGGSAVTGGDGNSQFNLCGTFKFATPGKKVIRMMYEKISTLGTPTRQVNTSRDTDQGEPDVHITVKPVAPHQPAPLLISSLNTPSTDKTFAMVSAYLQLNPTFGCAYVSANSEFGDWIVDGSLGGAARPAPGRCNIPMESGFFSLAPICTCTNQGGTPSPITCSVNGVPTTTNVSLGCTNNGGSEVDCNIMVQCHGPR